ncbi:MAG: hypothetical protein ACO1OK_01175 [Devosia sp.]
MEFIGPYFWLFAVLGGALILGLAIAFGMKRSAHATPREKAVTEAATRADYAEEDAERPD